MYLYTYICDYYEQSGMYGLGGRIKCKSQTLMAIQILEFDHKYRTWNGI